MPLGAIREVREQRFPTGTKQAEHLVPTPLQVSSLWFMAEIQCFLAFVHQVKQIMEEAVTRKFVHEDSSHIISFCGESLEVGVNWGLEHPLHAGLSLPGAGAAVRVVPGSTLQLWGLEGG